MRITKTWTSLTEPIRVSARLEDGSEVELFSYYSDELAFTQAELTGLTVAEARQLRHRRDVEYLQS